MRREASADISVEPVDLYAIASDLSNLPAWWIEYLSAEVTTPAVRPRDAVYAMRYRTPVGLVVGVRCTMVAARSDRALCYVSEGPGVRVAVGQSFLPSRSGGCRTRLVADVAVSRRLHPFGLVLSRLMERHLDEELGRALQTLGEMASARTVVRRQPAARRSAAGRVRGTPPRRRSGDDGRERSALA